MKKILVIGGNGFLGKNLKKEFKNENFCMFYAGKKDGLDLRESDLSFYWINSIKPDIIVNLAAHVGSLKYVSENSARVISDNSSMFLNLYNTITNVNRNILVINTLANCSYPGDIDIQNENEWWSGPIHDSVLSFGGSRKFGYLVSRCFEQQYGIKSINLIVPNAYGPEDYLDEEKTHAMNGIVMRMIKAQQKNEKEFIMWGSGSPIREWIFMPDVAKIIKKIISEEKFNLPNPINLGQERGVSISWAVDKIRELLNYDVEVKKDLSKPDGAPKKVLGKSLFRKYFPDFEFTSYDDGLKETINYYKENL